MVKAKNATPRRRSSNAPLAHSTPAYRGSLASRDRNNNDSPVRQPAGNAAGDPRQPRQGIGTSFC